MKQSTLVLYGIALIIRLLIAIPFIHDWDGYVFLESAKNLLNGETPYQTAVKNQPTIYPDSDRPLTQQWYAYPPLPLIGFTLPLAIAKLSPIPMPQIVESLLIKLPFILGDLVAARLLFIWLKSRQSVKAKLVEKLVLFNPLLIWVSSAWGMFDVWIVNLVLASIIFLEKKRLKLSGTMMAMALSIKLFPIFFLPLYAQLIWQQLTSFKAKKQVVLGFLATLIIINLPFLLTSPHGFINQNLLMHWQRPPQGISLAGLADSYGQIYHFSTSLITQILSIMMVSSLLIVYLYSWLHKITVDKFLWMTTLSYLIVLLFNKVTNEQYFVVLVLLLFISFFSSARSFQPYRINLRLIEICATFGALIAAFFLGFHFLSFLLPNIANNYFDGSTNQLVFLLSQSFHLPRYVYPNSVFTFYNLPLLISTIAILPFYLTALLLYLSFIWRALRELISKKAWQSLIYEFRIITRQLWLRRWGVTRLLFISGIIITSCLILGYKNSWFRPITLLSSTTSEFSTNPKVGVFYYVWWNNFSHDPQYPYDAWSKTTLTPSAGYYTSKNSYFVEHLSQMKSAGIDFAVVSYHLYDRNRYLNFTDYASQMGILYSPLVELGDALNYRHFRPINADNQSYLGFTLSPQSQQAVTQLILSSISQTYHRPGHFKINDRPVIFLYDSHWFFPSWDVESQRRLASDILASYDHNQTIALDLVSQRWQKPLYSRDDLLGYYPADILAFNQADPIAQDYQQAFLRQYQLYWQQVRQQVEAEVGPVYLISSYSSDRPNWQEYLIHRQDTLKIGVFDAEYYYSPANTWTTYRYSNTADKLLVWNDQLQQQQQRADQYQTDLFVPVIAQYDDTKIRQSLGFKVDPQQQQLSLYDLTWTMAESTDPDYILITSWNEFFEGTAIEPSLEHQDKYLLQTQRLIDRFKNR